jgi:hypothetical protein
VRPVDLSSGVAVRVAALCRDHRGRLSDKLLHDDAARGALALDLALAGRLEMTEDAVVVDMTPTGFAPADRLLAAIGVEPERSLDGWLEERRIGLADLAPELVASGRWQLERRVLPGRRYLDVEPGDTARDLARLPADWSPDWSAVECCVTLVAGAAGLLNREFGMPENVPPAVVQATGVAWVATAVLDHLSQAAHRYRTEIAGIGPVF